MKGKPYGTSSSSSCSHLLKAWTWKKMHVVFLQRMIICTFVTGFAVSINQWSKRGSMMGSLIESSKRINQWRMRNVALYSSFAWESWNIVVTYTSKTESISKGNCYSSPCGIRRMLVSGYHLSHGRRTFNPSLSYLISAIFVFVYTSCTLKVFFIVSPLQVFNEYIYICTVCSVIVHCRYYTCWMECHTLYAIHIKGF